MKTKIIPTARQTAMVRALEILTQGGVVAFPTDTVYGLGALVTNETAIEQLFSIKGRDANKAIAVLIGQAADLNQVAQSMSPAALRLVERFWPGPLTIIVPRRPGLPENLSPLPTIGVRMPDHPAALKLLRRAGPLAVTSANLSGQPNTTTAAEVLEQLDERIPLVLDGGLTPGRQPSTVVDCTGPEVKVLRPGPISNEQLLNVID